MSTIEPGGISRIRLLPETLINQIAAGEVVERPASILKELVENSIDAEATQIKIFLEQGGLTHLQVTDNGKGIVRDDLPLTTDRHATSKISQVEDLSHISSYGFRGEALASIASVSEFCIISKPTFQETAFEWKVAYGVPVHTSPVPTAGPNGTLIEINHLFEKLPARQKFMKTGSTEFSHSAKTLKEIALAQPGIEFLLYHQQKLIQHYQGQTDAARFNEVFKPSFQPLTLHESGEVMEVSGYLSPTTLLQDRGELYVYINRRFVKNKTLVSAVRNAYLNHLGPHHEPSGVLFLETRTDWIDVNAHPQKLEVRLLKQDAVYSFTHTAVKKMLQLNPAARSLSISVSPGFVQPFREQPPLYATLSEEPAPWDSPANNATILSLEARSPNPSPVPKDNSYNQSAEPIEKRLKYLGQVKASYLVCEDSQGLYIFDQHALHEKFVYEKLLKEVTEDAVKVQRFLLPKLIQLSPEHAALVEELLPVLKKIGFESEVFGNNEVAVHSRPCLIDEQRAEKVILEVFRSYGEQKPTAAISEYIKPMLATMACHSVVRANQRLSDQEAFELIDQLQKIELGWTCPHGRPVILQLSFNEIEKHFERK